MRGRAGYRVVALPVEGEPGRRPACAGVQDRCAVEHARRDRACPAGASMTAALSLTDRPQLRRGVRTGTDPLSGETVLLFPEGVLIMNETAAAVVRHCDGNHSVADVLQSIGEAYDDVAVEDVMSLLRDLIAQGLLVANN